MKVISKGDRTLRPTSIVAKEFGSHTISIPVAATSVVLGDSLGSYLRTTFQIEDFELRSEVVERMLKLLQSLYALSATKDVESYKFWTMDPLLDTGSGDLALTKQADKAMADLRAHFANDKLLSVLLQKLDMKGDKQSALFSGIADVFRRSLIDRAVSLEDMFMGKVLDNDSFSQGVASLFDAVSVHHVSNFYSSAVEFHTAIIRGRTPGEITTIPLSLVENPLWGMIQNLERMSSGTTLVNMPLDEVTTALKMNTHFRRKNEIKWNLTSIKVPEAGLFDIRDVYYALSIIESIILNVDLKIKADPTASDELGSVSLAALSRQLNERLSLESIFYIPGGSDPIAAENLIKFLIGQFCQ